MVLRASAGRRRQRCDHEVHGPKHGGGASGVSSLFVRHHLHASRDVLERDGFVQDRPRAAARRAQRFARRRHLHVREGPHRRAHRDGHHAQLHHPALHARARRLGAQGKGGRYALDRHSGWFRGRDGGGAASIGRIQPDVPHHPHQRVHVRLPGRAQQSVHRQGVVLGDDLLHRVLHNTHLRVPRNASVGRADAAAAGADGDPGRGRQRAAVLLTQIILDGRRIRARAFPIHRAHLVRGCRFRLFRRNSGDDNAVWRTDHHSFHLICCVEREPKVGG
mmetsp:Transcript_2202/g.3755  ORF Transcript_2202/g.3755 Transcript_2202/m.3755 type:complete len:277 (-) Transcript_2202:523-1353(-)